MKTIEPDYDAIFSTDIATIGLQFAGSKLAKIMYLDKVANMAATSKQVAAVKNKIETYLALKPKISSIKVEMLLRVTPFQEKVL
jgi:hypothetical protein